MSYLSYVKEMGHLSVERQNHLSNFSKPAVKSFLDHTTTHSASFLRGKTLKWLINSYTEHLILPLSGATPSRLMTNLLADRDIIEKTLI